jgi:hypothetical protein
MADDISRFHRFVGMCDDILALGKDFSIVLLVVLFLFYGSFLRKKLDDLGISELGPVKLTEVQKQNDEAKAVALQVSGIDQRASELETQLASISAKNPSVASQIAPVRDEITALNGQINSADTHLKSALLSQQAVLGTASSAPLDTTGWIYVGQEDEAKQSWYGLGAKNLVSPPPAPTFENGQTYTLSSDVYVHRNAPSGNFRDQGEVVGAWQRGGRVQVIDSNLSHAKSGGWFIWLNVKKL